MWSEPIADPVSFLGFSFAFERVNSTNRIQQKLLSVLEIMMKGLADSLSCHGMKMLK